LPRELGEFLIELSIGVHRYAMYPLGHPSLEPVADNIMARLSVLFRKRSSLGIGVADRQLLRGVTSAEVQSLLRALAAEVDRGGDPIGLTPLEMQPKWAHAELHPVGYEDLEFRAAELAGKESADRAKALWLALTRAALGDEADAPDDIDGDALAKVIREKARDEAYDEAIVDYLLQLAHELKDSEGAEAQSVRRQIGLLIEGLDEGTLAELVHFGGDSARRRRFLLDANQSLAVASVVRLLEAATSSGEQHISHSMTRMLSKLSSHAGRGSGIMSSQADSALRENVEALLEGWELDDPNPGEYTSILDAMSRAAPVFLSEDEGKQMSGAERLVEMALEVETHGPVVEKALTDLLAEDRGATRLLAKLEEAPPDSPIADLMLGYLTTPTRFRDLLVTGDLQLEDLDALVPTMGAAALDPLLDTLGDTESRTVRRRIFDILPQFGLLTAEGAIKRLDSERWYVVRNMLALLRRLKEVPADFDPRKFLTHADARVRREALGLALSIPRLRDRTLVTVLSDPDDRLVRMALLDLGSGVPAPVLPSLVNRVISDAERSSEIRAMAVGTLQGVRSPLALRALMELVSAGKTLFGKVKLSAKSPEVLVALRILASEWGGEQEVVELVHQAARAKDPDVRSAVWMAMTGTPDGSDAYPEQEGS
jgi:hypothetical protein